MRSKTCVSILQCLVMCSRTRYILWFIWAAFVCFSSSCLPIFLTHAGTKNVRGLYSCQIWLKEANSCVCYEKANGGIIKNKLDFLLEMVQGVGSVNTFRNGNIYIFSVCFIFFSLELRFISFTFLWMWKCRKNSSTQNGKRNCRIWWCLHTSKPEESELSSSRIPLKWFNRWVLSSILGFNW